MPIRAISIGCHQATWDRCGKVCGSLNKDGLTDVFLILMAQEDF
jgi:hypothetical protein